MLHFHAHARRSTKSLLLGCSPVSEALAAPLSRKMLPLITAFDRKGMKKLGCPAVTQQGTWDEWSENYYHDLGYQVPDAPGSLVFVRLATAAVGLFLLLL